MNKNNQPIVDNSWLDFSGLFGFIRMTFYFGIFVSSAIMLWAIFIKDGSSEVSSAMKRHDKLILVETLAEIPRGPFLHRIVDLELNKVCYLNAIGGGIQCFNLDDFTLFDEKLKEKLEKQQNKVIKKWKHKAYPYKYKNKAYND